MTLTLRTLEERLNDMVARGYRPRIKTHTFRMTGGARDEYLDGGWQVLPTGELYGWVVDALAVDGSQNIPGSTERTLERALVSTELGIDELAESRRRR